MAKETKAQRQERLDAERQQHLAVAKATYTERMMAVFARASKMNFELEANQTAQFLVSNRDDRYEYFYVDPVWSEDANSVLWDLEEAVSDKEAAAAERDRVANLRATALAKLTAEERQALSL